MVSSGDAMKMQHLLGQMVELQSKSKETEKTMAEQQKIVEEQKKVSAWALAQLKDLRIELGRRCG